MIYKHQLKPTLTIDLIAKSFKMVKQYTLSKYFAFKQKF